MRKYFYATPWFVIVLLAVNSLACSSIQKIIQESPTPTPTATSTLTPTSTPKPTFTPTSTATPNLAATQQYETFLSLVQKYYDAKYIPSVEGTYQHLDDYSDSYAKVDNYRWATVGSEVRNFIIKSHVTMSTANKLSPKTGCGFVFRTLGDFVNVVFIRQDGTAHYGTNDQTFFARDYRNISNPEEFDLVLIANENNIRFYIDEKEVLVYKTFLETYVGDLGFAIVSGSDDDYGSRCDFTNTELWVINE
jgi:hypothetical protein